MAAAVVEAVVATGTCNPTMGTSSNEGGAEVVATAAALAIVVVTAAAVAVAVEVTAVAVAVAVAAVSTEAVVTPVVTFGVACVPVNI